MRRILFKASHQQCLLILLMVPLSKLLVSAIPVRQMLSRRHGWSTSFSTQPISQGRHLRLSTLILLTLSNSLRTNKSMLIFVINSEALKFPTNTISSCSWLQTRYILWPQGEMISLRLLIQSKSILLQLNKDGIGLMTSRVVLKIMVTSVKVSASSSPAQSVAAKMNNGLCVQTHSKRSKSGWRWSPTLRFPTGNQ